MAGQIETAMEKTTRNQTIWTAQVNFEPPRPSKRGSARKRRRLAGGSAAWALCAALCVAAASAQAESAPGAQQPPASAANAIGGMDGGMAFADSMSKSGANPSDALDDAAQPESASKALDPKWVDGRPETPAGSTARSNAPASPADQQTASLAAAAANSPTAAPNDSAAAASASDGAIKSASAEPAGAEGEGTQSASVAQSGESQPRGGRGKAREAIGAVEGAVVGIKDRSVNAWQNGPWDVYIPFYAWHPAWAYDAPTRHAFHSAALGAGIGKRWEDANGNEDLIYAMAFIESHGHVEPIAGYARQWFTRPLVGDLRLGGGYTIGVTSRPDILSGVPFPLALPVVSAKAGRFSLMSAIVPGAGGIRAALVWSRIELGPKAQSALPQ